MERSVASVSDADSHPDYRQHLARLRERFDAAVAGARALFITERWDLWLAYLCSLPPDQRQHHDCRACQRFVERYGGLVSIGEDGNQEPVMWGSAEGIYRKAHAELRRLVAKARVTGVFVTADREWGEAVTAARSGKYAGLNWLHMAVRPPSELVYWLANTPGGVRGPRLGKHETADQRAAALRQDHEILRRSWAEYSRETVDEAVRLLESSHLYRAEKVLGHARWLADLYRRTAACRTVSARRNLCWLAVATAPAGFCHVRSTMLGTLLDDLSSGHSFAEVKRRFEDKMDPLQYQRSQVLPSAGNVARAEKIVAELQSAGALERRFARLDDLHPRSVLWCSALANRGYRVMNGVFGHVPMKQSPKPTGHADIPADVITWEKFQRTVLPTAYRMEYRVARGRDRLLALVTAANRDAPPILQWDVAGDRNPISWYMYSGDSDPEAWNLHRDEWVRVNTVALLPFMRDADDQSSSHGAGAVLILEGCRDLRNAGGLALFPEVLRAEYREVRATIEAYSRAGKLTGEAEANACGRGIRKGQPINALVRVSCDGGKWTEYLIDRWD